MKIDKIKIVFALLFLCFRTSFGQSEMNQTCDCYKIKFVLKNSSAADSTIHPVFQKHGFQLIENGGYDFVINGKKYFQSFLLSIDNSSFSISQNWTFENGKLYTADTLNFSATDKIEVRLVTIDKGVGGLPFKVGKDYDVSFVKSDKMCKMKYANIDSNHEFDGLFYFTSYGWKKMKMKKGKPFLCEATGQYQLRRR
ncbi:hypothetical protein [Dyadobacter sp. 32]|uniref:hypothetical protein n=1 Tax=Dyadobacter sp. 32 TaxID=538966 RepID=UPI0011F09903